MTILNADKVRGTVMSGLDFGLPRNNHEQVLWRRLRPIYDLLDLIHNTVEFNLPKKGAA